MPRRFVVGCALVAAILLALGPQALAGELPPDAEPGPLFYAALGDSYSSGEGAPLVTDQESSQRWVLDRVSGAKVKLSDYQMNQRYGWLGTTGQNGCHRSEHAYGPRVWGALDREDPLWGVAFVACSGARTNALEGGYKDQPAQFDAFAAHGPANLITLGMGGNDVGFSDIAKSCVVGSWFPAQVNCRRDWTERVATRLGTLRTDLRDALVKLKEPSRLRPGGRLMVVGYPKPFPAAPSGSCQLGTASVITPREMRWINEGVVEPLNAVLREEAKNASVSYVDTSQVLQAPRHDLCVDDGSDRWINRVIPSDQVLSLHPKFSYHERVAAMILDCWKRVVDCDPR